MEGVQGWKANTGNPMTPEQPDELEIRYLGLIRRSAAGGLDILERDRLSLYAAWLNKSPADIGQDVAVARKNFQADCTAMEQNAI